MKNFLVNLSKKHKELLSSLLLALVTGIVLLVALFGINKTVAWFASNKEVDADGLAVAVKGPKYDILIERNYTEFDRVTGGGNAIYDGIPDLRNQLTSEGYSSVSTDLSVNSAGLLAYNLVNLSKSFDEDLYYIMPGAYGYLVFYVKPVNPEEDLLIEFEIDIEGYYRGDTGMRKVNDQEVKDLLKGHLYFFEDRAGEDNERENHVYSGLLEGTYIFDSTEHTLITEDGPLKGCYKVKLYWEWPMTYAEIHAQLSDNENTRKYPAEMNTFINTHRSYVFADHLDSDDVNELSDGYDDGDQTIGNNCEYLVVFVTAYTNDD